MAVHADEYIQRRHVYEEHAYVLDYLPYGRGGEKSRHLAVPTAQIMGEQWFTLLEAELKVAADVHAGFVRLPGSLARSCS